MSYAWWKLSGRLVNIFRQEVRKLSVEHRNAFKGDRFGRFASVAAPATVTDRLTVPAAIAAPRWGRSADGGTTNQQQPAGELCDPPVARPGVWSPQQLARLRRACHLAAKILKATGERAVPGTSTDALDRFAHAMCVAHGAYPSPLNYRTYPKSICTAVNNVACHGIPDRRPLQCGDIVTIDVSVYLDGFHGDCSATFCVGSVDEPGRRLVDTAQRCRDQAIAVCAPGVPINTIGAVIESMARENGYTVVDVFVGHGIGTYFHGPPDIHHVTNQVTAPMTPGMTFTIEPVISQGAGAVTILNDGWTAVTCDGARAAQFEHTVLITERGAEVLTHSDC